MPPRVVKRGGSAAKRGGRTPKKGQNQQVEEAAKVEEMEAKEEPKAVIEEKPILQEEKEKEERTVQERRPIVMVDINEPGVNHEGNDTIQLRKENDAKDSVDEYGKDERLELDDNEPDYDPEEYCGVDYDEKEMEHEDGQEIGVERDEDPDDENLGEEEGDVHEELEDIPEEVEEEEDGEHASEDQEHQELEDAEDDEHHEVINERRKRKEFEVFVGGLDKDATEEDLKKVFSQVGQVTEIRLMMNPQTKKNKGFAFLRFATVEQAKRAVTELKNPVINGKQCGVTPSQDSDTLFLGNICRTWTKEALKEKLKQYGIENIEDLTLVEDSNSEGMNRGFAFLEFSSRSDAMDAYRRLQKRNVVFGVDRPAKVSFADSFIDPGDRIMAQVKTIFVDGLPPSWDEDRVRELLKKYGKVEKVELARNMPAARRKDYGFVTFDTHDAAVTCAKSINNSDLGEGENKAKVRARLSRPLQRGQGKHAGHGHLRSARSGGRIVRSPWARPPARSIPGRGIRVAGTRVPPPSVKRPVALRDRRPVMSMPVRARPVAPLSRSYPRRPPPPPISSYPKSSLKRDYRRDELPPPRSRAAADYGSRVIPERRASYRDEYAPRNSGYSDIPRGTSRSSIRRPYVDDGYASRFERPPPSYHDSRPREYESVSGMKRPYSAMDDVPPRYADAGVRSSRARLDYDYGSGVQYGDAYGDRLGRSSVGYGGSRSSLSGQDPHGLYGSRHGMSYGGSYGGSDGGGVYSSYGGDYPSRGSDVGSSYSLYSSRGAGGSGYMGSGGSGSYY